VARRHRVEVIVGAYLTQNTSWKSVERSLANLTDAGVLSIEGMRSVRMDELQILIRPSGFQTRKRPALKAFIIMLDEILRLAGHACGSAHRRASTSSAFASRRRP